MDFLLVSGGLRSGSADGMGKIRGTKRFQQKIGKLKELALMKFKRYHVYYGGKVMNRREAAILKHTHAKLQGFLPWRLHERADALLDHLGVQLFL
jgi:hypothetical protein